MTNEYLHGYDDEEQRRLDIVSELTYEINKKFLKIENRDDFNVLDIGCGTGYTVWRFAKDYPLAKFVGLDISDKHLNYAKKRCDEFDNCSFIKANILEEDIGGRYDLVFLKYVMIHFQNKNHKEVLSNIRKILKDNGRVSIFDNCWASLNIFPESDYFKEYVKDVRKFSIESGRNYDIGAKLGYLLHKTGFKDIAVEPVMAFFSKDVDFDSFQWKCESLIVGFFEDFSSLLAESETSFIHKYDIEKIREYKELVLSTPMAQIFELKFQAEGTFSSS